MRVVKLTPKKQEKERVCAYVRVSTNSSDQMHSFATQSRYWESKLSANPKYEYLGIFADEGISGKTMQKRDELNEMLDLARRGKIDRIFVKSVARFARSYTEAIQTIRELREINVPMNFDEEGIDTTDPKCNLMLSVYASLAQEELRSMSENQKWSVRKRYANGSIELGQILGYDYKDKRLIVNSIEAQTVKLIFELYLNGYGISKISRILEEQRIPNKNGKQNWSKSTVLGILKNEKYIGDSLLQKSYMERMSRKLNKGELPQYYIENSHEHIIPKEQFDKVQELLRARGEKYKVYEGKNANRYLLSGKIVCGKCGKSYRRKTCAKGRNYENIKWTCRTRDAKTVLIQRLLHGLIRTF